MLFKSQRNHLSAATDFQQTLSQQPTNAYTSTYATAGLQTFQRRKVSSVVKVDKTIMEKEPTLSVLEMMRILDARNEDIGLKKQSKLNPAAYDEPDSLEKLFIELADGKG